jgi:hypothetical protein
MSKTARRCDDHDLDGGRCQLISIHDGRPHAAYLGDAFVTWQLEQLHRWRTHPPPPWIIDLPWAPGLLPPPADDLT